jgi:predicted permease
MTTHPVLSRVRSLADALALDGRLAIRLLSRDRGFTITAVLVLGLGIGVNNMLFTILNAHTIRGLPIDRPDRVAYISTLDDRGADRAVSPPDFEDLRASVRTMASLAAFTNAPVVLGDPGRAPDRLEGTYLTPNAFEVLGIQPLLGRGFARDDDRTGAPMVVMLSDAVWRARYGRDRDILRRTILVNAAPASVVGIVPDRSGFPSTAEVWLPLSHAPDFAAARRETRILRVFGRLRDGASVAAARAEVDSIAGRLARAHPETNRNVRARVVPINERFLGRLTDPAWMALMTVGFLVVLISCANAANLLLDRSVRRARDIAIRRSLGATGPRVVRQLLVEADVLAALGGAIGLGLAGAGVRLFRSAIPDNVLPYWFDYSVDARVLAALVGVSAATVFVFGLVPAVSAARTDVVQTLKDGGRIGVGHRRTRRWTGAFLAAEFALTVVMLANLAVGLRLARPPLASDTAINTAEVLTATITLAGERYQTPEQRIDFHRRLGERLAAMPGISAASVATALPLTGAAERQLEVAGRTVTPGEPAPTVWTVGIGPRYFQALDLAPVRGRGFVDDDGGPGRAHAIINESFARSYFDGQDPIGRRIRLTPGEGGATQSAWLTIVGVSPAVRQRPRPDPDPIVYLPYRAVSSPTAALLVRSRTQPEALAGLLRNEVLRLDPNLPLYRVQALGRVVRDAQWNGRVSSLLFRALTGIALGLACVGLYAVTAHAVSRRTREIGLRLALGARTSHVGRLILRRALLQVAIGFVAGVGCTVAWRRVFATGRADVSVTDPTSLALVALVLIAVTMTACLVPVLRAIRLDPAAAIRRE